MDGDSTKVAHRRSFDEHGRALPMTDAEIRERNEAAIQGLRALDGIGDAEEQTQSLAALIGALGEHRFFSNKPYPR